MPGLFISGDSPGVSKHLYCHAGPQSLCALDNDQIAFL
jgi:hypothetical protein